MFLVVSDVDNLHPYSGVDDAWVWSRVLEACEVKLLFERGQAGMRNRLL